jgi:PAS domain S-box-containing protein
MAETPEVKILLVEDSPSDARLLQQSLRAVQGTHFSVTWVERLGDAMAKLGESAFDIGLLDLTLPDSSGAATFTRLLEAFPSLPIVVLTGAADETVGTDAIRRGVQDYLVKGSADGNAVARSIRYAIERKQTEDALRASRAAALNLMEDAVEARKQAEQTSIELASVAEERGRAVDSLSILNRTLSALGRSSSAMLHSKGEAEYLAEVCRIVVEDCGYRMVWIGLADYNEEKTVRPAAHAGFEEGYLETLNITWADTERGRGPTGTAIRTGKVAGCRDMRTDPAFSLWRERALQRGYASSVALPLVSAALDLPIGAITIYSKKPDAFSDAEIRLLSELANDLAHGIATLRVRAALDKATETLRAERNFSEAVIQTTGGLIAGFDPEGRIRIFNRACEKATGYAFDDVKGRRFWDFLLVNDEREQVKEVFKGIVDGTVTPESEVENYWVAKDGERRFIKWANSALRDEAGRVTLVLGTGIDITDRRTMEEQLHQKAVELTEANRELEAFAYSVSHDLRNPLHAIIGMIDIFKDYAPSQDKDFATAVGHLEQSSRRMADVISDLLVLSQVARKEVRRERVAVGEMALSSVNDLKRESPQRRVRFEALTVATVMVDPGLARILVENLVRNAWKFTSKKEETVIEFGAEEKNGGQVFFVRDNGVGFDMGQAEKIFEPFVRLHSDQEFKGTGIGLAIVKRIAAKHGGAVWAEAEKGKGAVFYFRLE